MKYAQLVVGPAGSGKSTYCSILQQHCLATGRNVFLVNLDPAAEKFSYSAAVDVRELINVDDVQEDEQLALGPNGALVFCMEYLVQNLDWLHDQLNEGEDDYFIFDCPGQIELYSHLPVMRQIVNALKSWNFNICSVFLLDTQFVLDCDKFLSGALTTLSTMVALEVPAVNVLSKVDLLSQRNKELLETFLETDTRCILDSDETSAWNERYRQLSRTIADVLDDYSLVRFIPLDIEEDESISDLLSIIDNTIQHGEDLEVNIICTDRDSRESNTFWMFLSLNNISEVQILPKEGRVMQTVKTTGGGFSGKCSNVDTSTDKTQVSTWVTSFEPVNDKISFIAGISLPVYYPTKLGLLVLMLNFNLKLENRSYNGTVKQGAVLKASASNISGKRRKVIQRDWLLSLRTVLFDKQGGVICWRGIWMVGDINGLITYDKLCKAVDFLSQWHSQAVLDFLRQFLDVGHLFDHRCKQLVLKFAQIEWQFVPREIRPQFAKLLRDIGVQYICHTEPVIRCFVEHLLAKIQMVNESQGDKINIVERNSALFTLCVTEEEQENIYKLATNGLAFIVKCFPVATKNLIKIIRQRFPHHSVSSIRYVSYVKNLILLCENIPQCRADIFCIIIDGLAQLDAVLAKVENSNRKDDSYDGGLNVFVLDEEYEMKINEVHDNNDRVEKLDTCMCYMFDYVGKVYRQRYSSKLDYNWIPSTVRQRQMFRELLIAFEEHLLMAQGLKNISFLWFFICSLDDGYRKDFLNWLWSFIMRLNQTPNEWKKAQGAACYIGSMLSRASYINLTTTMDWLKMMSDWCTTYVNEMVDRTTGAAAGSIRHGTFYAVFQAFLIAFCFRYREIVQAQEMVKIHRWGLGHIVHSALEPLSYISRPVALCFATISRSVQLVYVNHILPAKPAENMPFEPHFPFDSYSLKRSLSFISPLMRRFSPLAEDANTLKNELLWKNVIEAMDSRTLEEDNGSWEFLDDIRRDRDEFQQIGAEVLDAEEKNPSLKFANEFLTVYSTSPGLKQFRASSFSGVFDFNYRINQNLC
uniref:GPN-loop GTPase 3 n=1 Tax=Setaria digitata TaxID=48799 RepID=A0A915PTN0_9BILA